LGSGGIQDILCHRSSLIQEFTRVIVFRGNTVHTLPQILLNAGIYQGNCVQGEQSAYSATDPPEIVQEFTRVIVFRGNTVHTLPQIPQR